VGAAAVTINLDIKLEAIVDRPCPGCTTVVVRKAGSVSRTKFIVSAETSSKVGPTAALLHAAKICMDSFLEDELSLEGTPT
jgi:hypothetical protein